MVANIKTPHPVKSNNPITNKGTIFDIFFSKHILIYEYLNLTIKINLNPHRYNKKRKSGYDYPPSLMLGSPISIEQSMVFLSMLSELTLPIMLM